MTPIGSNSVAAQQYSSVQRGNSGDAARISAAKPQVNREEEERSSFALPSKATPKGDWVLSENANPQSFDSGAPRGSYLNLVV